MGTLYLASHLCILVTKSDLEADATLPAKLRAITPSVDSEIPLHPLTPTNSRSLSRVIGLLSLLSAALGVLSVMHYALFSETNVLGGCVVDGRDSWGLRRLRLVVLSVLAVVTMAMVVPLAVACRDAVGGSGVRRFCAWEARRNPFGVMGAVGLVVSWVAAIALAGSDTPILAVAILLTFTCTTPLIDLFFLIEERDVGVVAPHALGVTCSSVLMYLSDIILPCLSERQSSQSLGSRVTIAVFHLFLAFQVVRVVQYAVLKMRPSTSHIPSWATFDRRVFCQLHMGSTARTCNLYYSPYFLHVVPKDHDEMRDAVVVTSDPASVRRAEIKPKFGGARMAVALTALALLCLASTLVKTAIEIADTRVGSINPQTGEVTVAGITTLPRRPMPEEFYDYYKAIDARPVSCLGPAGVLALPGWSLGLSAVGYATFFAIFALITGNLVLSFKSKLDFLRVYRFQLRRAPIFVGLSAGVFVGSIVQLALGTQGDDDAAFSLIAAPFALWAIPVSELFHITGHRSRITTAPVIFCVLTYFAREAFFSMCSCANPSEATALATFVVRFRRVLFRLWLASIAKFVLPKLTARSRDVPLSIKFDASRQCQRGFRNGDVQVPYSTLVAEATDAVFFTPDESKLAREDSPGVETIPPLVALDGSVVEDEDAAEDTPAAAAAAAARAQRAAVDGAKDEGSSLSIRTIIVAPMALFLMVTMVSTFVVFVITNNGIVGSTSVQLSTQISSQVMSMVAAYFRGPHVALSQMKAAYARGGLPFDGTNPEAQRLSEEFLFDVVENIEGAAYLSVAIDGSGHFLGCEYLPEANMSRLHVRNATYAPARWSFNGTSMPLGRPSTPAPCEPYTVNPNYDVHARPWYNTVVGAPTLPAWSDPYMFTDRTRIGILLGTAVRDPRTGKVVAVLGVDCVVSNIIQTLTAIAQGLERASASVHIVDRSGLIIAGTSDNALSDVSTPTFVALKKSESIVVRRAALAPEFQRAFREGSDAHYTLRGFRAASVGASVRFFPEGTAPPGWSVLVITRQDELQMRALKTAQAMVLTLGMFFLVAIVATDHLAHRISRPILAIAENIAENIAAPLAARTKEVRSSVAEIRHLSRRARLISQVYRINSVLVGSIEHGSK